MFHSTKRPPNTADFNEQWAFLNAGVDHIMKHLEQGISFTAYDCLYTTIYNYCTSTKMHGRLDGNRSGAILLGSDLYNKLSEYFILHFKPMLQKADTLSDVDLLRYYASEWDRYTTGAKYLTRLFTCLNRYWVKRERDEGRKDVLPVYRLALSQWKEHFLLHIQKDNSKLSAATLRLITQQRNGETIDQGLVKKVVDSFVSLGIDNADLDKECLDVYTEQFETSLIYTTEAYYKRESEIFLAENSVPAKYLKKAEERLLEEENRVEQCLHTKTRKKLINKCETVLIREHGKLIQDSFQHLLDFDQDKDLQRMYSLLSRIPENLEDLRNIFEAHVKQAGLASISKLDGQGGARVDPKAYVDALLDSLLEVRQKYSEIVNRSFRGEAGFVASLDKAVKGVVNCNAATGSSSTKSPELIAKYVDMLLRKNNKMAEEDDLEGALDRLMTLFKYLEGKDVFQTLYTTKFSKRLIHGTYSDESEASMISKLKEACGFEYFNRLQRMFTDISLSKDLTDSFKAQNDDDMGITFAVMVLGSDFWPLNPPPHDFTIPVEILSTYDRFTKYYQTEHLGRKLTWLWNCSTNELRMNYLSKKYSLLTSSYQMVVLLQYNQNDTMSLDQLVAATAISKDILAQVLAVLAKAKLLVSGDMYQYDLNPRFKSKKIRVNLNLPTMDEIEAESTDALETLDENRKYFIQAAVVRIMKVRKKMKHQTLIQEVTSQISQNFVPKIPDIKKAIEILLDKGYMERVDDSKDTYAYVV